MEVMEHRAKMKGLLESNFIRVAGSVTDALAEELSRMGDVPGTQVAEVTARQIRMFADEFIPLRSYTHEYKKCMCLRCVSSYPCSVCVLARFG